jgi:hypothetical protein
VLVQLVAEAVTVFVASKKVDPKDVESIVDVAENQ